MNGNKIIKANDFTRIINDTLNSVDLPKNSIVFIAGTKCVPEDKNDIYNLRLKLIACKVVDGHVDMTRYILIDPKNLKKVSKNEQNNLYEIFKKDFEEASVG